MSGWVVEIDRDDFTQASLSELELPPLQPGQIAVSIDSFGLTANNVTYAVFGKYAPDFGTGGGYFDFFGEPDEPGRLPVWGFATVTQSRVEGITVGDRYYGYLPMASDAVLTVGEDAGGRKSFVDVTPRRAALPGLYNNYRLVSAFPDYRPQDHDLWLIFRGLFFTAWLIMDQAEEEADFASEQVLLTSASSKTAISYAYLHAQRAEPKARLMAVTSAGNSEFVGQLGLYDEGVTYDDLETIAPSIPTALIDVAGSRDVVKRVHAHFGESLKASIAVGFSHWNDKIDQSEFGEIKHEQFFAPSRSKKRVMEWGGAKFGQALGAAWVDFMDTAVDLTKIDKQQGGQAALEAYRDIVAGKANPRGGTIIERG